VAESQQKYRDGIVSPDILPSGPRKLLPTEVERLWELFKAIGYHWGNTTSDSAGQRSSWTEFVLLRADSQQPYKSYVGEFENALRVIEELNRDFPESAYEELFQHKTPKTLSTRFDHAKKYVVDEFIRMQVVAGGFRGFGSDPDGTNRQKRRPLNYNGFVRGSRYNRLLQVRDYPPKASEQ